MEFTQELLAHPVLKGLDMGQKSEVIKKARNMLSAEPSMLRRLSFAYISACLIAFASVLFVEQWFSIAAVFSTMSAYGVWLTVRRSQKTSEFLALCRARLNKNSVDIYSA